MEPDEETSPRRVEIVLNLKQLGEINPKMVLGIFDHHLKNDLTGYPKVFRRKIPVFTEGSSKLRTCMMR